MNDQAYESAEGSDAAEESSETTTEEGKESEVDQESLEAYVDQLSPSECHALYKMLQAKYDGDADAKKYSMADIAEGK